jgi:nitroimidazol reductase NimA-like FMN-containing flavoprotein (pyridoxamine 5'-phosphate oxidase superfamily)
MTMTAKLDSRYGDTDEPARWDQVNAVLESAELYWLTTVRRDGRPHVTPLVGVWMDTAFVFCTGPEEQKAHNLAHGNAVAVTTGVNTWQDGLDMVVEGRTERITGLAALTAVADVYREKYRGDWDFNSTGEGFKHSEEYTAHVYRVVPDKVLAFAKSPHGQTRFTRSR